MPGPVGLEEAAGYDWNDGPFRRQRAGVRGGEPVAVSRIPTSTSIGAILTAFFAPNVVGERLWVMRENDSYTRIVRAWLPVQRHVDDLKREAVSRPLEWQTDHRTVPGWSPPLAYVAPPNCGWNQLERSPPGTDPETARHAFLFFLATGVASDALHTSAIGSFRLMATAAEVDMDLRKIILDIWMYNEMSARSFGRFAHRWPFEGLPMPSQFMWWNWKEKFNFEESGSIEPSYRGNLRF